MHIPNLVKVYVYPSGEVFDLPPAWMSDDYEIRYTVYCDICDELMEPHYAEPFISCGCKTMEWYIK